MPEKETSHKRKHLPVPLLVLLDVLLIAVTLNVYALFQHVLPSLAASGTSEALAVASIPTSTPVSEAPQEETQAQELTWAEKFADHFTDEITVTDTSYSSPNIAVELRDFTTGEGSEAQHWFVEDIYLTDISYFQTWTSGGQYSSAVNGILSMSEESGAVAAINGDYAAFGNSGYVIRNGVLRRNDVSLADVCVLYYDGTIRCYDAGTFDAEEALANGAWQAWTFGPVLLNADGTACDTFSEFYVSIVNENPRTALGYYEPGHYCFVVADGRQTGAAGLTMTELAQVMQDLGCTAAYNLDGGASTQMTLNGTLVNSPVDGGRVINDILIIREESAGDGQ